MNDLYIKWSNQPHSVEDCFNVMFPHDYFNHVIDLTNANLPVSVRNFTKHKYMQCIGVPIREYLQTSGTGNKKAKLRIIISMASHLGVACAQSLLQLLITAAQLAAMPMVANHLQCVVLSLGGTVQMCLLSLCTRFEECSNCFTGHLAYTYQEEL